MQSSKRKVGEQEYPQTLKTLLSRIHKSCDMGGAVRLYE